MKPLVSVIIATYNGKEKWFTQTLDAILNQSYKNIELIIINDASTNNIEDVILRYCKKYDNIIYLKNEKNSERSYSRNKGIFESKGKYIAFCDDDDVRYDKDKLKKQVEFLEKNRNCVMCGTSLVEIDENNNELQKIIVKSGDEELRENFLKFNEFAFSSVMIKKYVLGYSGLFNSEINKAEDYDLRLRIGRFGGVDNLNNLFIWYRTRQGNTSTTSELQMKKQAFKLSRDNRRYYPGCLKALFYRIAIDFLLPKSCIKLLITIKKHFLRFFNKVY